MIIGHHNRRKEVAREEKIRGKEDNSISNTNSNVCGLASLSPAE